MISLQSLEAAVGNPRGFHRAFNERHLILHAGSGTARLIKVRLTVHVFVGNPCVTRRHGVKSSASKFQSLGVMSLHFYCAFIPSQ